MRPVDSHCHLDFEKFNEDRPEVLERCRENLEFVVNAGRDVESNRASIELQRQNPGLVVANLGLHPVRVEKFGQLEQVKKQIREHRPAAVGEIGLDHRHVTDREKRGRQEEVFRQLLELAEELKLPVVVHSRDAESRAVEALEEYELSGVMLHCFNGDPGLAEEAACKGMKIGVTTQVLYSSRVQQIAKKLDVDSLLLETDSPFLYRGGRNEPVNVAESVGKVAGLKGIDRQEVVEETTGNARRLFR